MNQFLTEAGVSSKLPLASRITLNRFLLFAQANYWSGWCQKPPVEVLFLISAGATLAI
tara:strand:+ start:30 stop:203 length:174 start_codon:yes stop_codon:yes gene_type:complete